MEKNDSEYHISNAELDEWRKIIEHWPQSEREKWITLTKSGRLVSFVVFMDNITNILSQLGRFGLWLNSIFKGFIYIIVFIVLVIMLVKGLGDGSLTVEKLWEIFK